MHGQGLFFRQAVFGGTRVSGKAFAARQHRGRLTQLGCTLRCYDADPEGNESSVSRGYLKASHLELDKKESKPWHPVLTHTNPRPLVPGRVYRFDIDLIPLAVLF